ncbi:MAG: class I SAM-dependent methyltransferase [Brevirhabdus sp.]
MVDVKTQYDTYPYPHRNPADERKRLVTGSPSIPVEIDHYVFGGKRNWRTPLRALVAGGGTGDGLIQLATLLSAAKRPYEITYVDLSETARGIAEERARIRGLTGIRFLNGSLLDAASIGTFDYIDCCGVLHHLPDPDAGFRALSDALAPEGGIGLMVYAPYGRSGVYPLQEAFGALFQGLGAQERLQQAKSVLDAVPDGHPFKRNPHLVDHEASDAGFYDLLLHSQDRPYGVSELNDALVGAGLSLAGFVPPAEYDLARLLPEGMSVPDEMDEIARMALAEKLRGTIKTHVAYAVKAGRGPTRATGRDLSLVPHLKGVAGPQLAAMVAKTGQVRLTLGGTKVAEPLAKAAAPLVAGINGRMSVEAIAHRGGLDRFAALSLWAQVDKALGDWGLMHYSRLLS